MTGPNMEAMQEVQLETTSADASTSTGGVRVNVVPKDGGNTFSGSLFFTGTNEDLQSRQLLAGRWPIAASRKAACRESSSCTTSRGRLAARSSATRCGSSSTRRRKQRDRTSATGSDQRQRVRSDEVDLRRRILRPAADLQRQPDRAGGHPPHVAGDGAQQVCGVARLPRSVRLSERATVARRRTRRPPTSCSSRTT